MATSASHSGAIGSGKPRKTIICFSGIKTGAQYSTSDYRRMVEALGYQSSSAMDLQSTAYLVLARVGSDKHVAALRHNIPCVTVINS